MVSRRRGEDGYNTQGKGKKTKKGDEKSREGCMQSENQVD